MKTRTKRKESLGRADAKTRRSRRASDPRSHRKSRFTVRELEELRVELLAKRREVIGDDALRDVNQWDRAFTSVLVKSHRRLLCDIDDALLRIEAGTYGICEATQRIITKARLRAIPWARYCFEYAMRRELGQI